jgi:hypothetical protein
LDFSRIFSWIDYLCPRELPGTIIAYAHQKAEEHNTATLLSIGGGCPGFMGARAGTMTSDRVVDLLLGCLHQDATRLNSSDLAEFSPDDWQAVLTLARNQRVQPLLYRRLASRSLPQDPPSEVMTRLRARYLRVASHGLRLQQELGDVVDALAAADVPVIALKGIYLASCVYDNVALREMNDIDVLVPRDTLRQASARLNALGYAPINPGSIDQDVAISHHLDLLIKDDRVAVEVHWNLTRPGLPYSIEPEELWQRMVPVRIAGRDLWSLALEDLILHLCVHTSYQHQFIFGLRPSCDLAEVLARHGADLDWDALLQRAERWRWQRGVFLALRLARDLVGADVPEEVLARLRPTGFDERIAHMARLQILGDTAVARELSPRFAIMWKERDTRHKVRAIMERVFLPRYQLAQRFGHEPTTRSIMMLYVWRLRELMRRYARQAWDLRRGDTAITDLTDRRNQLAVWLSEKAI